MAQRESSTRMKRRLALLALFLLTALISGGCNREPVYYRNPEEPINVRVEDEFIIGAPVSVDSVFIWRETYDEDKLELLDHTFGNNEEAREQGKEVYLEQQLRFRALKAGSANVTLALVRRTLDEAQVREERTFTVEIE